MGVSCSGSGGKRWRTELELDCRQSLDDHHGAATLGTEPKRVQFLRRCTHRDARCPPKAAVRQLAMARSTVRCCQVIHRRLRSMKARPVAQTRSATSSGGRFIYGLCGDLSFSLSEEIESRRSR